jgi:hypothetical protein
MPRHNARTRLLFCIPFSTCYSGCLPFYPGEVKRNAGRLSVPLEGHETCQHTVRLISYSRKGASCPTVALDPGWEVHYLQCNQLGQNETLEHKPRVKGLLWGRAACKTITAIFGTWGSEQCARWKALKIAGRRKAREREINNERPLQGPQKRK